MLRCGAESLCLYSSCWKIATKKNLMTSLPASHQAFVALKITPGCGEFTVGNAHSHPTLRPPSRAPGKEPGNKIQYSCWCWRQIRAGGNAGDTSSLQNL